MLNLKAPTAIATLLFAAATGTAGAATSNGFANGGFEVPGGAVAQGWLTAPTGNPVTLSGNAHSGSHSVLLTVPNGFGASTLFQDSLAHGGMPALTAANAGDTPTLSFWVKGDVSTTGNIMFALSFRGDAGTLWSSGNHFFQNDINANSWTLISFQTAAIPVGTTAAFLEINTAVGPLLDGRVNAVYLDDVQLALTTAPVPEPETYALLIAGLGVVGAIARRRRA
ncbi:PEP-CTERM sorting domain-containing protein [Roseateles sp. P5_E7]